VFQPVFISRKNGFILDLICFIAPGEVNQALVTARLDHFDYAWVLGRYPARPTPDNLSQEYADEETRLFRITR